MCLAVLGLHCTLCGSLLYLKRKKGKGGGLGAERQKDSNLWEYAIEVTPREDNRPGVTASPLFLNLVDESSSVGVVKKKKKQKTTTSLCSGAFWCWQWLWGPLFRLKNYWAVHSSAQDLENATYPAAFLVVDKLASSCYWWCCLIFLLIPKVNQL